MSNAYSTLNEIVEWLYGVIVNIEAQMEFFNQNNRPEERHKIVELSSMKKAYVEVLEKIESKMERRELKYVRK